MNINVDEEFVYIDVVNHGEKINYEDTQMIFEKYYTGINKFSQLSIGLGLYCANKIVLSHKGSINVFSNEEKTVFTVKLAKSK